MVGCVVERVRLMGPSHDGLHTSVWRCALSVTAWGNLKCTEVRKLERWCRGFVEAKHRKLVVAASIHLCCDAPSSLTVKRFQSLPSEVRQLWR